MNMVTAPGSRILVAGALLLALGLPAIASAEPRDQGLNDGRYIVKFKRPDGAAQAIAAAGGRVALDLAPQNAVAAYLPEAAVLALQHNPNVEYVEVDVRRYPRAQTKPYGIGMVQADDPAFAVSGASVGSTVCIIDSGYYMAHEDLQDSNVTGSDDPTGSGSWTTDTCGHGTHVAGIVSALDNTTGVVGVNGNGNIRLHIVKVFDGASCGWAYSSTLVNALNVCRNAVANTGQKLVVSMSLGGTLASSTENSAFDSANKAGVLSIAAAGNGGNTQTSYPAGYASVMSVAAVDSSGTVASFSQQNADVEIAAPGVGVLSTLPFKSSQLRAPGGSWFGNDVSGSARTDVTGTLADGGLCGSVGAWSGKVVLCQRGGDSFATKVANVKAGGGIGAAIYNNVSGGFSGTLNGTSTIPAISLSQEDGLTALADVGNAGTLANSTGTGSGYAAWDGTSMATPYVSGVAALIWSLNPSKNNLQLREALQATALDKGAAGRDPAYGFGIVRAKAAYDRLQANVASPISLTVTRRKSGGRLYAALAWLGTTGTTVDYYRGATKVNTPNDYAQNDGPLAAGTYTYKVCNAGSTTVCSASVSISL